MKIGIAGHIATDSIARFLDGDTASLPRGYYGAPLLGTLIGALLERGHSIVAYTTSSDMPHGTRVGASGDRFKITYCAARPRAFRYSDGHWGRAADAFRHERALLAQSMQDDAPDLVHAHWSYEFALAAIESGLPHVVTCHDVPQVVLKHAPNLYRLVRYFMARRVLDRAQHVTAVSPYLKQMVEGYARVPISVIPNPLPAHPAHLDALARQYNPARPRIAMVLNGWGALKNPQPALRAFSALRRTIPAAELSIMGSDYGPGEKAESWARTQGLTAGVHFMGQQPYSILLDKLAESDLLLHPSLEETFGMSIAEAMSLGVPVVGGQSSGAVPWVIGEGGVVTDVTSVEAIESALVHLLVDPATHQRHSKAARERAHDQFGAVQVADAYVAVYSNAMHLAGDQSEEISDVVSHSTGKI
jgi:glycosyltransferase involved in cell wall biosynthesis